MKDLDIALVFIICLLAIFASAIAYNVAENYRKDLKYKHKRIKYSLLIRISSLICIFVASGFLTYSANMIINIGVSLYDYGVYFSSSTILTFITNIAIYLASIVIMAISNMFQLFFIFVGIYSIYEFIIKPSAIDDERFNPPDNSSNKDNDGWKDI